jgi:hypothetical protein
MIINLRCFPLFVEGPILSVWILILLLFLLIPLFLLLLFFWL